VFTTPFGKKLVVMTGAVGTAAVHAAVTVTFWPGVGIVKFVDEALALANVPAPSGETVHPVKS
jgi:hypothetical protein